MSPTAVTIDVVSDVVCPWCLVGITRLNQAIAEGGYTATVRFHPFQLDPSTPEGGVDLKERLARKYGADPQAMFARVEAEARSSGIPLDFSRVSRGYNTLRAHTLIRHAADRGTQPQVKLALLGAYFLEGQDIDNVAVLDAISQRHGFGPGEVAAVLARPEELDRTREEAEAMRDSGVSGVPFTVVGGRYALSGAQPVEAFRRALELAVQQAA